VFISGSHIQTPENDATRQLRDEIERQVPLEKGLYLSTPGKGDARILITTPVSITQESGVTMISFYAAIVRDGFPSKVVNGTCPRSAIGECATAIIRSIPN